MVLGSMRSIFLILVFMSLALAAYGEEPCELCGVWQSNEAKTLEDIRANRSDLEDSSFDYPNGFFGRLINEFSKDKTRAYFIDDEAGEREPWLEYRAVDSGEGLVTIHFDALPETSRMVLRVYGDCFALDVGGLYWEHFCRVPK